MKMIAAKTGLLLLTLGLTTSLGAADATTALLERLNKGECAPSDLTDTVWTIVTGPVGTHGQLNWGDQLVFTQTARAFTFNNLGAFAVSRNGKPWKSATGWSGSCVRSGNLSIYVITGMIELNGCLHELAIGRLDHDDALGSRIEVIFEHAESRGTCDYGHGEVVRHPGHAHGEHD